MTETRHQASRAFGWSLANTLASRLGTMLIGVVMARVLGPDAFGTFAVAWVAMLAVLSLNDLGVSLAVVRWREEPQDIAPTVTTMAVASSVVLAGLMAAAAGPFAELMGDPSAAPLVRLLALSVVIDGLVATPAAVLQRTFRQDRRLIADQANVWVGAVVSLALVLGGTGALSLVLGRLAGSLVAAVLFLHFSPIPYRFGFDPALARRLVHFGFPLAGASVLVFAIGFIDQLVVGRELGPRQLAFYVQAFNLASWPVALISGPLRSVAPALFARLRDDPEERTAAFEAVLRPLAAVTLPACVAIAAAAPAIVTFVYGEQWAPSAGPLRWLAAFAALRILFELAYDYVVVVGSSRRLLLIQGIWLLALVPAVEIGARSGGTTGTAIAVGGCGLLVILPAYARTLSRLGIGVARLLRDSLAPLAASAALGAAIVGAERLGPPPLVLLLGSGAASLLVLGGLLHHRRADLATWRPARTSGAAG